MNNEQNQNNAQNYNSVNSTYPNNTPGYNPNLSNNTYPASPQSYNQNVVNNVNPVNNNQNVNNMVNYNNGYQQPYTGYQNNGMNGQYYNQSNMQNYGQPIYQTPKKSSPVLLVLVIILFIAAVGGAITYVVLSNQKDDDKVVEKKYKNTNDYEDDSNVAVNNNNNNSNSNGNTNTNTNQTSTVTNSGFTYEKLAGFNYTESTEGLIISPLNNSYAVLLTPIESPYQSVKAQLLQDSSLYMQEGVTLTNFRNEYYSGVDMLIYDASDSADVGYIIISAIPSKQDFTMHTMIIFNGSVRDVTVISEVAKIINSAKYVGNYSNYAKDLNVQVRDFLKE